MLRSAHLVWIGIVAGVGCIAAGAAVEGCGSASCEADRNCGPAAGGDGSSESSADGTSGDSGGDAPVEDGGEDRSMTDGPSSVDGHADAPSDAPQEAPGCEAGTVVCGGQCVSPNDPAHCGSSCTVCAQPDAGSGVATCAAGACDVSCSSGYHKCNGGCYPDSDVPSNTNDPCVLSDGSGVFVSASTGNDSTGNGSAASPYASITKALGNLGGKARIYVCNGTYNEQVSITGAVGLFGGLTCAGTWSYAVGTHAQVNGPANEPALLISAASAAVDIEDMAFTAPNASSQDSSGNGQSSIAALVNASSSVTFHRCGLTAGSGASGAAGSSSSNYTGATASDGSANNGATGGSGGVAVCGTGTSTGGNGGDGVSGSAGGGGNGTASGSLVTQAGFDGTGEPAGAASCGSPSANPGANGTAGSGGAPALAYGSLAATGWTPTGGGSGNAGNPGQGGGGGGGKTTPATGGTGGGAGGCGGAGGTGGHGGGASLALASVSSSVTLDSACTLATATGGAGGEGGDGQTGQAGGATTSALACLGNYGGNGAGGSGGAGGTGGVSVCIVYSGTAPSGSPSCQLGTAGNAGGGGSGQPGGNNALSNPAPSGNAGATGLAGAAQQSLQVQ